RWSFRVGDDAPLVVWCLRLGPARVQPAQAQPAQVRPLEAGAAKATPAPLGSGSTGAEPAQARPLETGAFSGLLEGSVVGADRVDLGGRGGVGVELEVEPDLDELLGGLEADHTLA